MAEGGSPASSSACRGWRSACRATRSSTAALASRTTTGRCRATSSPSCSPATGAASTLRSTMRTSPTGRRSFGLALPRLGRRWRQAVFVLGLDQLGGDGQPHEGAHDLVLGALRREGGNDVVPAPGQTITQQFENDGRDAGHHRVRVGGGPIAIGHGDPMVMPVAVTQAPCRNGGAIWGHLGPWVDFPLGQQGNSCAGTDGLAGDRARARRKRPLDRGKLHGVDHPAAAEAVTLLRQGCRRETNVMLEATLMRLAGAANGNGLAWFSNAGL